jgi:hypothetical protein
MNKLVEKLIGNKYYMYNIFYFYFIHTGLNWVQNNSILLDSIVNLKKNKIK